MPYSDKMDSDKVIYVYRRNRSFRDLFDDIIDLWISRRLARKSYKLDQEINGKIAVFTADYIGIQMMQHGFFEKKDLDMIFSFLNPILSYFRNATALDVGANIGSHSLYFSPYFADIWAFEPHPRIYSLLAFNSQVMPNINVYNLGAGEIEGSFELNQNLSNMGSSSIKHVSTQSTNKVSANVVTLDEFCSEIDNIALMKIDVEGFEPNVLLGASNIIRKHQPLILIEQLQSEFANGTTESIEFLLREKYLFCWHQSWSASHNRLQRAVNSFRNLVLGKTYDYDFVCGSHPPVASYDMLIAIPRRFQGQLCLRR